VRADVTAMKKICPFLKRYIEEHQKEGFVNMEKCSYCSLGIFELIVK
jgi:hypothetical protein